MQLWSLTVVKLCLFSSLLCSSLILVVSTARCMIHPVWKPHKRTSDCFHNFVKMKTIQEFTFWILISRTINNTRPKIKYDKAYSLFTVFIHFSLIAVQVKLYTALTNTCQCGVDEHRWSKITQEVVTWYITVCDCTDWSEKGSQCNYKDMKKSCWCRRHEIQFRWCFAADRWHLITQISARCIPVLNILSE